MDLNKAKLIAEEAFLAIIGDEETLFVSYAKKWIGNQLDLSDEELNEAAKLIFEDHEQKEEVLES